MKTTYNCTFYGANAVFINQFNKCRSKYHIKNNYILANSERKLTCCLIRLFAGSACNNLSHLKAQRQKGSSVGRWHVHVQNITHSLDVLGARLTILLRVALSNNVSVDLMSYLQKNDNWNSVFKTKITKTID